MPEQELQQLPVYCPKCGKPVTLSYFSGKVQTQECWRCPWEACGSVQTTEIRGNNLQATAGHSAC